jgi:hypothetical protein
VHFPRADWCVPTGADGIYGLQRVAAPSQW